MVYNQQFVTVGVSRQAAKGTPTAAATFNHGLLSGMGAELALSHNAVATTAGVRAYSQVDRTMLKPGFSFDSKAYIKSFGMWACGAAGTNSVTGAGPYTHTITGSLTQTLPYLTFWGQTDLMWVQVRDAMVDKFSLEFKETGETTLKASGFGTTEVIGTTPPTVTNNDLQGNYLTALGGTVKFDTTTSTPVLATVKSGSFSIDNNIQDLPDATSIHPSDVYPGQRIAKVQLVVQVADSTGYRAILTGSTSGTVAVNTPSYGSTELNFLEYGSTGTLKIATPRVAWNISSPTADPNGGPVELTLDGEVLANAGATDFTFTLINGIATY